MPLEQVNIGAAENDPNADTLRAAFEKVNALVAATNQAQSDLAAMVEALAGKAPASHTHAIGQVDGLQAALDDKAPASSIWTQEQLQDLVAAMFQTGTHSNASITYDDASGSLSITASGGGGASLTEEEVEDFVGGLIVQGTGISVAYDDAGNVLSISLAGESYTTAEKNKLAGISAGATANATNAQLRDRSTHTGTQAITTITGLQAALDGKASASEIAAARGSRSTLGDRLDVISNFASPNAGGIVPGRYYDNARSGSAGVTFAGAANRAEMSPFYTSTPLTVDEIGCAVSTGVAGALGKCFIYEANALGWPSNLLFEGIDLDLSSTGLKVQSLLTPFTFQNARQYWLGFRHSQTATIRAVNLSSTVNLGLLSGVGTSYGTVLRRTVEFETPMPAVWVFDDSEITGNVPPPSVRMRAV